MSQDQERSDSEREMAYRIVSKCLEEHRDGISNINRPLIRASVYTGLSTTLLRNIQRKVETGAITLSNTKRIRKSKCTFNSDVSLNVDDFDRHTIHRCVEEFVLSLPNFENTGAHLLKVFKEKFAFPLDIAALCKLMKAMGYCTQPAGSVNFRYGLERRDYVLARKIYLEQMQLYRQNGRNIIYIDETWIDQNRYKKYWRIQAEDDIITDVTAKDRLILMHAGCKNGFLDKVKWLFEAGITQGDLQVQMGEENFELWVTQLLIPNLPQNSVIVMDSASYHNELYPIPTKRTTKEEMLAWVKTELKDFVDVNDDIEKDTLFNLIELYLPSTYKQPYKIDTLLKRQGHDVLRVPPCMNPEFNPMLLAWEKIASIIDEENVAADSQDKNISANLMKTFAEKAISQVTTEDWREFDSKVKDMENVYWLRDRKVEDVIVSKLGKNHGLFEEVPSSDSESD